MRISTFLATACLIASPSIVLACNVTIGDYKLEDGSIESSSVVDASNAQAVFSDDAGKKVAEMAKVNDDPVVVHVGSKQVTVPLKTLLSEKGPVFFKDTVITIPGENNTEALVIQQEFKRCL